MSVYGERVARMEVEVQEIRKAFEEYKEVTNRQFDSIKNDLQTLLALRNKGAGAFWLATVILGTGIVGVFEQLVHWLRG